MCRWYSSPSRVDGVPEAAAVGQPGDAGRSGVRDAVGEHLAGGDVHHVQHAVLGAALAEPVGDERAVVRGVEPVDGDRPVGSHAGGVDQHAWRAAGSDGAAHHQRVLVGAMRALEDEQPLAGDREVEHGGQRHERGKALVPPTPGGPGIERLSCSGVVSGDPLGDLGGLAVLQPPIGVGHLDAVVDVGLLATPGGGRKGSPECQPRPMLGRLPWFALLRRRRALRFLVFFDMGTNPTGLLPRDPTEQFVDGPGVEHPLHRHPDLGGPVAAVRLPLQLAGAVRVGVDGEAAPVLHRHLQQRPRRVEPFGTAVDLDRRVEPGTRGEHVVGVEGGRVALADEPTGAVTEDVDVRGWRRPAPCGRSSRRGPCGACCARWRPRRRAPTARRGPWSSVPSSRMSTSMPVRMRNGARRSFSTGTSASCSASRSALSPCATVRRGEWSVSTMYW